MKLKWPLYRYFLTTLKEKFIIVLINYETKIYENTLSNIEYYIAREISILICIVSFIFSFKFF